MSSWTIWEPLFLPNQVLKYISRLRWSISPNSVWSCPVVSSFCLHQHVGWLAADTTRMRSPGKLAKQACYLASTRVEGSPFSLKGSAEVRANLSLSQGRFFFFFFFFRSCVAPLPVRGFLEFLHFFRIYFYFIYSIHSRNHKK